MDYKFPDKLQAIKIRIMDDQINEKSAIELNEGVESTVNPTVAIAMIITISTFFILSSTMDTVLQSFS